MSVVDKIHHYQRNIEKCSDNEDRMLHCISKLSNLPVTVQHLQETGVGRTVNALRKFEGGVGDAAKALVAKWKTMVANEESSECEEEDEACVPDAPESYSDSRESPKPEDAENIRPRRKSEETKHSHRHKSEKNEISSSAHSKHTSKQESKLKSSDECKNDSDSLKQSGSDTEKQKKHEKSKHSHKHQSRSERKSSSGDSKDSKSASKKDEVHNSKPSKHENTEKTQKVSDSGKTSKGSRTTEENNRKRKSEGSSTIKKESKRRKHSESESDEGKLEVSSSCEKQDSGIAYAAVKIKEEPKDKETPAKVEIKQEKKDTQEKPKASSSKHKSDGSSSGKLKETEEKQSKQRTESNNPSHKKEENRKDDSHHSNKESSESKQHSSSSSTKHHDKSKDRNKKKEHKEEKSKKDGGKTGAEGKESKQKHSKEPKDKAKVKQEINGDEGIDCNSGASFAEALGMCMVAQTSKKRNNALPIAVPTKSGKTEQTSPSSTAASATATATATTSCKKQSTTTRPETSTADSLQPPSLLSPNVKLEPLNVDLASTLPEISPNYKPLPYINPVNRREEDKALTDVIYVKNQRTKVYSGNKSGYTSVPSLYEMCIRVLIENIDALEVTGGVPYDIIKPVLERATPDQLFMLEHYNPYLIEDTDPLWQFHCSREFRNKQREEMETWREMYMRCLDEREAKLKTLTANIKQSIDKSLPVRSTKLAYVDNVVKPPRNVLKKQAKYGTANAVPNSSSNLKKKLIAGGGSNAATNISVPPPPMPRMKASSGVVKKTKAPLMAKALQLIKGRYKR